MPTPETGWAIFILQRDQNAGATPLLVFFAESTLYIIGNIILMFFFRRKKRHIKSENSAAHRLPALPPGDPIKAPPQPNNIERIAASLFSGPEKYNCAQAILIAFQERFSVQEADIRSAKSQGYGRVQGGLCGALYVGKQLLKDPEKAEELTFNFEERAGSTRCKRILRLKLITCRECVALTARLLDQLQ